MPKLLVFCFSVLLSSFTFTANAEPATLKPFSSGSYQQLLASKPNKPFILVIWSLTCSSCLKDMTLLNKLHKDNPTVDMVMLTTDDMSAEEQVQQILAKNELVGLENWIFADDNAQKLRYEIDPLWYGEMPRTYFYNKKHEREGVSGVLSQKEYESRFKQILN